MRLYKNYHPATLVEGYRWYIEYYATDPITKQLKRFRETYGLNRAKYKSMTELQRRTIALKIVAEINEKLPFGFPFEQYAKTETILVSEAIDKAWEIKKATLRKQTYRSYTNAIRIFKEWLRTTGYQSLPLEQFSTAHAITFMDYVSMVRKVGPYAYNNYLAMIRSIFMVMEERKMAYLMKNPWMGIKKQKSTGKKRRAFNEREQSIITKYIQKRDPIMMLGIALQYYCFIRPDEQRRLLIRNIDLNNSVIRLNTKQTKNKMNSIVTIPDAARSFFLAAKLDRFPDNWIIFGKGIKPHPDTPCGERSINSRHRHYYLLKLVAEGLLTDIDGLSYYSWKDTGAHALVKKGVPITEVMRQMRHQSLDYTQRYLTTIFELNPTIKRLDNRLMGEESVIDNSN